jgi:2'-5' RNA ligase
MQSTAWHAVDPLRVGRGDSVSWVRQENLHYTMRFLGEVDDDGAARAGVAMREAAASRGRFGAVLGGFGAFPTAKKARVLWIGMTHGAESMRLLAEALELALKKQRFERADQPFEPHLTVGRVRMPGDWTARLIDAPGVEARFQVDRLWLMQSALGSGGSRYERIGEAPLAQHTATAAPPPSSEPRGRPR